MLTSVPACTQSMLLQEDEDKANESTVLKHLIITLHTKQYAETS